MKVLDTALIIFLSTFNDIELVAFKSGTDKDN